MGEEIRRVYEFGPFRLDAGRRVLLKRGQPVKLFPKEFDTLLALVEHSGEVLAKEELMQQVWQDAVVEESNLTTNISHLRKLLGESRGRHPYIVTIPGKGYRFVAGVREAFDEVVVHERTRASLTVEEEGVEVTAAAASAASRADAAAERLGRRPVAPAWRGRVLLLAAAAAVLAAAAFAPYRIFRRGPAAGRTALLSGAIKLTRLTNSGRATLAAVSSDGRYVVHVSKDAEGESLWLKQVATHSNVRIAPPADVSYWGLTFSPDGEYVYCVTARPHRGDTSVSIIPVLGGPARTLPMQAHGPVSFSPDGRRFAYVNAHRDVFHLYVADADGGNERLLATRTPPEKFVDIAVGPAWSPDGAEIACAVRKYDAGGFVEGVTAVRVADGAERPLTARRWSAVGQLAWLPGGAGLVVAARESPSAPFQLWHLPADGGDARRVTNDLDDYRGVSYNPSAGSLLAVQTHTVTGVWVAPYQDLSGRQGARGLFPVDAGAALQVASGSGRPPDVAWTPDGKVVYVSSASDGSNVWVREPGAEAPRQLTLDARNIHGLAVSPDGRHLVYSSDRAGAFNLWRVEMGGGEPVRLTRGEGEVSPRFSPDGRWVVYQKGHPTGARIWRVSVNGGEEFQLTESRGQKPDVSPDGRYIAYYTLDSDSASAPWVFGYMPSGGGRMLERFTFPPTAGERIVRWVPGGRGLAYLDSPSGVSNIWAQPLGGGSPQRLSDFNGARIDSFEWSLDGRWLAIVRSNETSDVVIVEPMPQ